MTQPTDDEVLDEALGKIEIASSMSADDFGRYWIEGIPEAKKLIAAHFAKKQERAVIEERIDAIEELGNYKGQFDSRIDLGDVVEKTLADLRVRLSNMKEEL